MNERTAKLFNLMLANPFDDRKIMNELKDKVDIFFSVIFKELFPNKKIDSFYKTGTHQISQMQNYMNNFEEKIKDKNDVIKNKKFQTIYDLDE